MEHVAIQLSKLLEKQHEIEKELDELKTAQIVNAVQKTIPYDSFLRIKEDVKKSGKEEKYVERLTELKAEIEQCQNTFNTLVTEATEYMQPDEKGNYFIKLADCTVTYSPKPKFTVGDMDESTKLEAIQEIVENEYWDAIDINKEKYMEMNQILKEQAEDNGEAFQNCPGISDRTFFLKEEFAVRKKAKKSK